MKKGRIIFKGNFGEYFVTSMGLLVISFIITGVIAASGFTTLAIVAMGVIFPYLCYWMFKYFFTKLEIEIYDL